MLTLLALACWIGGIALLLGFPWVGAGLMAAGVLAARAAMERRDDVEQFAGLCLMALVAITAWRALSAVLP